VQFPLLAQILLLGGEIVGRQEPAAEESNPRESLERFDAPHRHLLSIENVPSASGAC
jgi:hypothetical protein